MYTALLPSRADIMNVEMSVLDEEPRGSASDRGQQWTAWWGLCLPCFLRILCWLSSASDGGTPEPNDAPWLMLKSKQTFLLSVGLTIFETIHPSESQNILLHKVSKSDDAFCHFFVIFFVNFFSLAIKFLPYEHQCQLILCSSCSLMIFLNLRHQASLFLPKKVEIS